MILRIDPGRPVPLRNHIVPLLDRVHKIGMAVLEIPHAAPQPDESVMIGIAELRIELMLKKHCSLRFCF